MARMVTNLWADGGDDKLLAGVDALHDRSLLYRW
jgi:hypothetical protein